MARTKKDAAEITEGTITNENIVSGELPPTDPVATAMESILTTEKESESPKQKWRRDKDGLIEGIEYIKYENGKINWLAMIPKEFFVINKQATNETDVAKVDDKHKLILLAGFKYLASLRGYIDEDTTVTSASATYVGTKTSIRWMANFETNNAYVTRSGIADAHPGNVSNKRAQNGFFAPNFLMTISENRSFVRAVKNFLEISVLGQDELGMNSDENASPNSVAANEESEATSILQSILDTNNISFEQFKNSVKRNHDEGRLKNLASSEEWKSVNDIPTDRIFELTKVTKDRVEERKAAKAAASSN